MTLAASVLWLASSLTAQTQSASPPSKLAEWKNTELRKKNGKNTLFYDQRAYPAGYVPGGARLEAEQERLVAQLAFVMHGLIALEDLNVELSVEKRRAGRISPLIRELTEFLLQIVRPHFLAREIERVQIAIAIEEHHGFSVGDRGGR